MKGNTALLIIVSVFMSFTLYLSYINSKQIKALQQENAELREMIDNSEQPVLEQSVSSEGKPVYAGRIVDKVEVTAKYRLEDRYVSYKVCEPEYLGRQVGEVVLDITVNIYGDVKSAKLQKATGITDEEVIEACKKAALKTSFNYDSGAGNNSKKAGTITYIFTEK